MIQLALSLALCAVPQADLPPEVRGGLAADFPGMRAVRGPAGQSLEHAAGLRAQTGLAEPELAARAFLARYGAAFGLDPAEALPLAGPAPAQAGAVRFARQWQGLPVFGAGLAVQVEVGGVVELVNATAPLGEPQGRFSLEAGEAGRLALAALGPRAEATRSPTATQGWLPLAGGLRAAWRVDLISRDPVGVWRTYLDAETGRVLFRHDLRRFAQGRVFDVSPTQTAPGSSSECPVGTSGARTTCANASLKELPHLSGSDHLTGTQTKTFNCKKLAYTEIFDSQGHVDSHCTQDAAPNADGNFDYAPDFTGSFTDSFAEVSAYFHVDKHINFLGSLDPALPGKLGLVPGFVNLANDASGRELNNAFFSSYPSPHMAFGQASNNVDTAYDGETVYHEMTHAAVDATASDAFQPLIMNQTINVDPIALNEGTADSMAAAEVDDPSFADYTAHILSPPRAYFRKMDAFHTCGGQGKVLKGDEVPPYLANSMDGRDGEEHDDGEIWDNYFWEIHEGLKGVDTKDVCAGCDPAALIQLKAMEASVSGLSFTQYARNMTDQARKLFSDKKVGDLVECVGNRYRMSECDKRTVDLYGDEQRSVVTSQGISFAGIQVLVHVTANNADNKILACGPASQGHVYIRKGSPVQVLDVNTVASSDQDAPLPLDCSQAVGFDASQAGEYYVLFRNTEASSVPSTFFQVKAVGPGMAKRVAAPTPITCAFGQGPNGSGGDVGNKKGGCCGGGGALVLALPGLLFRRRRAPKAG